MTVKCTILFDYNSALQRSAGWSESYYFNTAEFAVAQPALDRLCNLRANLLGNTCTIVGQRLTLMEPPYISQSYESNFTGNKGASDVPQMALQIQCATASGNKRNLEIRGLPDARVEGGEYHPSDAYDTALTNFFAGLVNTWQLRGRDKSQPLVRVQSVDNTGAFILGDNLTYNVGQQVRFFRTYNTIRVPIKGTYTVGAKTSATVGALMGWTNGVVIRGKLRVAIENYFTIARCTRRFVRVRKVGRSFFQYSGRASIRR